MSNKSSTSGKGFIAFIVLILLFVVIGVVINGASTIGWPLAILGLILAVIVLIIYFNGNW